MPLAHLPKNLRLHQFSFQQDKVARKVSDYEVKIQRKSQIFLRSIVTQVIFSFLVGWFLPSFKGIECVIIIAEYLFLRISLTTIIDNVYSSQEKLDCYLLAFFGLSQKAFFTFFLSFFSFFFFKFKWCNLLLSAIQDV